MKKRNLLIRSVLLLGIMVVLASGMVIPFADAKDVPIPKMMTWTSYDVGSSGYMMVGHISTTLYNKYGTKIRILPAGTDIPRVYPIRLKDAEVAFHGLGSYFMQEGLGDYSSAEWGPQPVRALYFAQHPGLALGIRGDSKIKSWKDIKGKKIATFPGSVPLTLISEVHLAFAGLTWKDVKPIKAAGYSAAIKMVMSGKIDATHINPTASKAYEMEAMPYGISYIALPFKNKKNWEQLISHAPAYGPFLAEIGATLSPKKPLETVSYAYPIALVYDFLPEDKAYIITKMLVEAYPEYAKKHKSIEAYWSPKGSMALFEKYPLPMHKGAIRYYKEVGMWTPELEAKNQARLAHQVKLKKLWDSAIDEALKKKMKMRKFGDFWKKKRAEAGL
jgi:TRAP transporter TAXI family solute receptor